MGISRFKLLVSAVLLSVPGVSWGALDYIYVKTTASALNNQVAQVGSFWIAKCTDGVYRIATGPAPNYISPSAYTYTAPSSTGVMTPSPTVMLPTPCSSTANANTLDFTTLRLQEWTYNDYATVSGTLTAIPTRTVFSLTDKPTGSTNPRPLFQIAISDVNSTESASNIAALKHCIDSFIAGSKKSIRVEFVYYQNTNNPRRVITCGDYAGPVTVGGYGMEY
jgi:hypothetical protein